MLASFLFLFGSLLIVLGALLVSGVIGSPDGKVCAVEIVFTSVFIFKLGGPSRNSTARPWRHHVHPGVLPCAAGLPRLHGRSGLRLFANTRTGGLIIIIFFLFLILLWLAVMRTRTSL